MKKLFLTVLYNQIYSNSKTLCCFRDLQLGKDKTNYFIIWDNSKLPVASLELLQEFLVTKNIEYINTPENLSLAKIYNECLYKQESDLFLIFDQDTYIDRFDYNNYIETVYSNNCNIPVYIPRVNVNNKLYSPSYFFIFKGFRRRQITVGINKSRFYTAIMSGTIINTHLIKRIGIRFNEKLKLYGVDTAFFYELSQKIKQFYLLDIELDHNLSEMALSKEERKKRVKLYVDACKIISDDKVINLIIIKLYEVYLRVFRRIK